MANYFTDKVVVVTGGTDGIGKALVDALLALDAKVATCGRNHDKLYHLQSAYPSYPLHTVVADVSGQQSQLAQQIAASISGASVGTLPEGEEKPADTAIVIVAAESTPVTPAP